jgi:hypothetical protein
MHICFHLPIEHCVEVWHRGGMSAGKEEILPKFWYRNAIPIPIRCILIAKQYEGRNRNSVRVGVSQFRKYRYEDLHELDGSFRSASLYSRFLQFLVQVICAIDTPVNRLYGRYRVVTLVIVSNELNLVCTQANLSEILH